MKYELGKTLCEFKSTAFIKGIVFCVGNPENKNPTAINFKNENTCYIEVRNKDLRKLVKALTQYCDDMGL